MTSMLARHEAAAKMLPRVGSVIAGDISLRGEAGQFSHVNPATGRVQADIPLSGADAVEAAVAAARAAAPA